MMRGNVDRVSSMSSITSLPSSVVCGVVDRSIWMLRTCPGVIFLSRRHIFWTAMLLVFSVVLILFKDIPDIKGDEIHRIKSLASQIGPKMASFGIQVEIIKPDFSELKSSAPLYGGSNELLFDAFSDALAFYLPVTSNADEYQKKFVKMVKPAKGTTTVAFVF
nr:proteasome subunit beta type-5-like [Tanacetum cinerariifolium]